MPPMIDAVRLPKNGNALRIAVQRRLIAGKGGVSYCILDERPQRGAQGERRNGERTRSRLRSGKLLDAQLSFLADCLIHDRSSTGARIRLLDARITQPDLHFYDDETETLRCAHIVWRRGADLGLHYSPQRPARDLSRAERLALKGLYYTMRAR